MSRNQRESEPFVVAVEATRMPMIFVDAKSDEHRVIFANVSFLELMSFQTIEQVIGQPFSTFVSGMDSNEFSALVKDSDQPSRPIHYVSAVRPSGVTFTAALLFAPIEDLNGEAYQFFVSFVDISEGVDLGETSQRQLRDLYLHAPGFVATTTGPNHRITFANSAYRTLVGSRALTGKRVVDAFPDLAEQGFVQLLDEVYQTKRRYSGRRVPVSLIRAPEGERETRFIDFVYQPMLDEKDQVTGVFCEGFDVTDLEKKEAEFELLQAQYVELSRLNAMGNMAATLAHELNQPLAAISNYAAGCMTLLQGPGSHIAQVEDGLEAIASASDRAGHIIRRLRDMTKRAQPVSERFNLSEALTDAIQLVNAGSFCEVKVMRDSCVEAAVLADRIQTQQVIINLLKNACEAAAQGGGGNVSVCISKASKDFQLRVADDGPGIALGKHAALFSWSESDKPEGMGMGLSISRTIIENQGGKIWLVKTGPGGTDFAFSLPAAPQA